MDTRTRLSKSTNIGDQEFEYSLVPIGEKILGIWTFSFARKLPDGSTTTKPTGESHGTALRVVRWISGELRRICDQMNDDIRIIIFVVADKTFCRIHNLTLDKFASRHNLGFYSEQNAYGEEVFFVFNRKISVDPARLCVPRDLRISFDFKVKSISEKIHNRLTHVSAPSR